MSAVSLPAEVVDRLARGALRAPPPSDLEVPGGRLQAPDSALPARAGARALDEAAAAVFLATTATRPVSPTLRFPSLAPSVERPLPVAAVAALAPLLSDGELLVDALAAAAEAGWALPLQQAPAVLDALGPEARGPDGSFARSLTTGERGGRALGLLASPAIAWLAAQNPAWAWAVPTPENPADGFEDASADQRERRFRVWRQQDPAGARGHLEATGAALPAAERMALVQGLSVNLGPNDETFLDTLFDDRAPTVRREAAWLLARLPSAAFTRRAQARAFALVRTSRTMMGLRRTWDIDLPEERSEAAVKAARDGVDGKATLPGSLPYRLGPRQKDLALAVALVAPSAWRAHLQLDDSALVGAFAAHDYAEALLSGWVGAALTHDDTAALEALTGLVDQRRFAPIATEVLIPELARRDRFEWMARHLQTGGPDDEFLDMLQLVPAPWPDALAQAIVDRLHAIGADAGRSPRSSWGPLVATVARRARPDRRWLTPPNPTPFMKQWYDQAQAATAARLAFYDALEDSP